MNTWAKLSLACIPIGLLTLCYGITLERSEPASPAWILAFFIPFVGIIFASGAKKPIQIAWLRLLNLSCYPLWIIYGLLFVKPMYY